LRYQELRNEGSVHGAALQQAARDVGGALALCAVTTGVGFFAFLPTEFAGVSELGLIAGVGMFISLAATLTLMPALLSVIPVQPRGAGVSLRLGARLDRLGERHGRGVRIGALVVALFCVGAAFFARFDDNPLNLRDAGGEAVSTYRQLVADGDTWSLDLLARDPSQARRLAGQLDALHQVKGVVSLQSFIPSGQAAALADLDELALLLGPDLAGSTGVPTPPGAARPVLAGLARTLAELPSPSAAQQRLARALERLQRAIDSSADSGAALLASVDESVTGMLAAELSRVGQVLEGDEISLDRLPESLSRDWRSADGRMRLRVDAREDLNEREALAGFVDSVRGVAPGAVGVPVVHLESARVVVGAFAQAFALALASIVVILLLVLRRVGPVVMALVPLILAALVTVGVLVVLQVPFNFANVIALPLLLGVGVDSGIHMLTRARMSGSRTTLAASGTARGVVTSAVSTAVSFGNLAFSVHPGTASMGVVLSVGMVCVLAATLLVMPALAPVCLGRESGTARR
jgi:hopanoid biosynthesis associated RND transporter like protein HpnN